MIGVLLVDDHAVVRAGLAGLLASHADLRVVGEAGSGIEALRVARETSPDVALVDLAMPGMDGIETTRQLVAAVPSLVVVVLSAFSHRSQVLDALAAGASGYLLKDAEPADVVAGVREAAAGGRPLHPDAERHVTTRDPRETGATLTAREREVLAGVADGLPNKQIAAALGISEKTVKTHLTRVYEAVGVTDRVAAALWAHRNGVARPR